MRAILFNIYSDNVSFCKPTFSVSLKPHNLFIFKDINMVFADSRNKFINKSYRVRHNHSNTHFMIVLDEKQSSLKDVAKNKGGNIK